MTRVDQFESVFKAASKTRFQLQPVTFNTVGVVTDLDPAGSQRFLEETRDALTPALSAHSQPTWTLLNATGGDGVGALLRQFDEHRVDLICTYRNLGSAAWHPTTLGDVVTVLTQATPIPIALFPHPTEGGVPEHATDAEHVVMALTDHLTGDSSLVNSAVAFTPPHGSLLLTHVEDRGIFDRYLDVISKIPSIETEDAERHIRERLLKEPLDFAADCRRAIEHARLPINVREIVTLGHNLQEHQRLVEEHRVDLLVMKTKDEDQLAMHGLAYPLSVELRQTPLLLL